MEGHKAVRLHNMQVRRRFHGHVTYRRGLYRGCWTWNGKKECHGWGVMKVDGKRVIARRLSWELHYGPIPEGMGVYRWCPRQHECVNPNHLFLSKPGDYKDNLYLQFDDLAHKSKFITLSESEISEARALYKQGVLSKRQLASQFKVGMKQLERVLNGRAVYHKRYWFEPGGLER